MTDFWLKNEQPPLPAGVPCSPGCASHVSHPCEKCGRYAAGMVDGRVLMERLIYLSQSDPVIHRALIVAAAARLSREHTLLLVVDGLVEGLEATRKALGDCYGNRLP